MRRFALLSGAALALLISTVAEGEGPPLFRRAATVTLSNGQAVPVLSAVTSTPTGRASTMILSTENGTAVAEQSQDDTWDHTSLSFTSGGGAITLRFSGGFYQAGLPTPMELRIGKTVYRWLWKDVEVSSHQRAAQKAVAALPEDFRKDLVTFALLCDAAAAEFMTPSLGVAVPSLLADPLPKVGVASIKPLTQDAAAKIFGDRTR
jgi:hypothetical protein